MLFIPHSVAHGTYVKVVNLNNTHLFHTYAWLLGLSSLRYHVPVPLKILL